MRVFFIFSSSQDAGFEVGAVVNDSPVDCQSREWPSPQARVESHALRQMSTVILIELSWAFFMPKNRLK